MRSKFENDFKISSFNRTSTSNDDYLYDLSYELDKKGEIKNIDVIKQRISTILSTIPGERFFNNTFGTRIYGFLFNEDVSEATANKILDFAIQDVLKQIKEIKINNSECTAVFIDDNSIEIYIEFMLKKKAIKHSWKDILYF